ncbi:unnamed protein product [Clavelina lepadiformis]|uniref:Uncharacterized protein n=2 Tax=Clavelina lepadiformis TaxID=159417 RepID=A0ABP0FPA7_CLALP
MKDCDKGIIIPASKTTPKTRKHSHLAAIKGNNVITKYFASKPSSNQFQNKVPFTLKDCNGNSSPGKNLKSPFKRLSFNKKLQDRSYNKANALTPNIVIVLSDSDEETCEKKSNSSTVLTEHAAKMPPQKSLSSSRSENKQQRTFNGRNLLSPSKLNLKSTLSSPKCNDQLNTMERERNVWADLFPCDFQNCLTKSPSQTKSHNNFNAVKHKSSPTCNTKSPKSGFKRKESGISIASFFEPKRRKTESPTTVDTPDDLMSLKKVSADTKSQDTHLLTSQNSKSTTDVIIIDSSYEEDLGIISVKDEIKEENFVKTTSKDVKSDKELTVDLDNFSLKEQLAATTDENIPIVNKNEIEDDPLQCFLKDLDSFVTQPEEDKDVDFPVFNGVNHSPSYSQEPLSTSFATKDIPLTEKVDENPMTTSDGRQLLSSFDKRLHSEDSTLQSSEEVASATLFSSHISCDDLPCSPAVTMIQKENPFGMLDCSQGSNSSVSVVLDKLNCCQEKSIPLTPRSSKNLKREPNNFDRKLDEDLSDECGTDSESRNKCPKLTFTLNKMVRERKKNENWRSMEEKLLADVKKGGFSRYLNVSSDEDVDVDVEDQDDEFDEKKINDLLSFTDACLSLPDEHKTLNIFSNKGLHSLYCAHFVEESCPIQLSPAIARLSLSSKLCHVRRKKDAWFPCNSRENVISWILEVMSSHCDRDILDNAEQTLTYLITKTSTNLGYRPFYDAFLNLGLRKRFQRPTQSPPKTKRSCKRCGRGKSRLSSFLATLPFILRAFTSALETRADSFDDKDLACHTVLCCLLLLCSSSCPYLPPIVLKSLEATLAVIRNWQDARLSITKALLGQVKDFTVLYTMTSLLPTNSERSNQLRRCVAQSLLHTFIKRLPLDDLKEPRDDKHDLELSAALASALTLPNVQLFLEHRHGSEPTSISVYHHLCLCVLLLQICVGNERLQRQHKDDLDSIMDSLKSFNIRIKENGCLYCSEAKGFINFVTVRMKLQADQMTCADLQGMFKYLRAARVDEEIVEEDDVGDTDDEVSAEEGNIEEEAKSNILNPVSPLVNKNDPLELHDVISPCCDVTEQPLCSGLGNDRLVTDGISGGSPILNCGETQMEVEVLAKGSQGNIDVILDDASVDGRKTFAKVNAPLDLTAVEEADYANVMMDKPVNSIKVTFEAELIELEDNVIPESGEVGFTQCVLSVGNEGGDNFSTACDIATCSDRVTQVCGPLDTDNDLDNVALKSPNDHYHTLVDSDKVTIRI